MSGFAFVTQASSPIPATPSKLLSKMVWNELRSPPEEIAVGSSIFAAIYMSCPSSITQAVPVSGPTWIGNGKPSAHSDVLMTPSIVGRVCVESVTIANCATGFGVGSEFACVEPTSFVAVTSTRIRKPMSALVRRYVDAVAPSIGTQPVPVLPSQ